MSKLLDRACKAKVQGVSVAALPPRGIGSMDFVWTLDAKKGLPGKPGNPCYYWSQRGESNSRPTDYESVLYTFPIFPI